MIGQNIPDQRPDLNPLVERQARVIESYKRRHESAQILMHRAIFFLEAHEDAFGGQSEMLRNTIQAMREWEQSNPVTH